MKFNFSRVFQNPNSVLNRRNRHQLLVALLINILTFSHGIGVGWMSPVMRDLRTENSPFDFAVVVEELSWVGSVLGIGSIIGNILVGVLHDRIGRKLVMYILAIPHTGFWLLTYYAQSVEYLYVGRLLAGISGGGSYIALPIFISEIADANIRGTLGSTTMLSVNMGVLAGYIIATNVSYLSAPFCILALPTCYLLCNFLFPETPHYLIRKGRHEAAEKSYRYYKNFGANDGSAAIEFEELKSKLTKEQHLSSTANSLNLKDFATGQALKAYGTAIVLLLTYQFSGIFCITSYLADVFAASHTSLNANACTIVVGVVQIMGNYTTTLLCDKYGRKILLLVSCLGCAASLAAFGCFTHYADDASHDVAGTGWLPLMLLSLDIFLGSMGLVGCSVVLMVELFPAKIRSVSLSVFVVCLSGLVFVTLKIFPLCLAYWGISLTMWSCSAVSLFGFLYFSYFLEETKGKCLEDA
ncbi:facilitated trehalose transporter Tret1-like [Scaptodrosophila lebanonensis]|uniref:Facilitated trehalose transporter Tret1-like n=1 Tax=Drosophila lebanonensis TaxID=7225 RepID=A0A6J2U6G9_DROLE|nr:facilitated trehalose transporter Tret1-like [Scaptodrosophila lebanonensis]